MFMSCLCRKVQCKSGGEKSIQWLQLEKKMYTRIHNGRLLPVCEMQVVLNVVYNTERNEKRILSIKME